MPLLIFERDTHTCASGFNYYSCNTEQVTFNGCCAVEACTTGCPTKDLADESSSGSSTVAAASRTMSIAAQTTSSGSPTTSSSETTSAAAVSSAASSSSPSNGALSSDSLTTSSASTDFAAITAAATPTSVTTPSSATSTNSDDSPYETPQTHFDGDKAAVIGATCGAVALVVFLTIFFLCYRRRVRAKRNRHPHEVMPYIAKREAKATVRDSPYLSGGSHGKSFGAANFSAVPSSRATKDPRISIPPLRSPDRVPVLDSKSVMPPYQFPDPVPMLDSKTIFPTNEMSGNQSPPPHRSVGKRESYLTDASLPKGETTAEHATSWSRFTQLPLQAPNCDSKAVSDLSEGSKTSPATDTSSKFMVSPQRSTGGPTATICPGSAGQ